MTGLGWRPNASGTVLPLENLPIKSALTPPGGPFSIDALIDCQIEHGDNVDPDVSLDWSSSRRAWITPRRRAAPGEPVRPP
jgi:hypothetical protein